MDNISLTSRIVGAIVVLSLGIIFIPLLLETDNIDSGSMKKSPIPEIPNEISTIVFQLNEETGKFEEEGLLPVEKFEAAVIKEIDLSANEVEMPEVMPVVAQKAVESLKPKSQIVASTAQTAVSQNKSRHTWVLQLASFKDKEKALKLRDELRKKQYVTHAVEGEVDSGKIWRVRIGPELDKDKIINVQKVLEKEMGLKGLIVRRR